MTWARVRAYLREHRYELAAGFPPALAGTPLLSRPSWLPATPIPLSALDISLVQAPAWDLPAAPGDPAYPSYSAAMAALDAPTVFENRPTWRLLEADLAGPTPRLVFGDGWYFDSIDTGEAAAHEYAAAQLDGSPTPLRDAIADPTDLLRRPANMAISALTIRRAPTGDQFLLHWRDPKKVGHAGGLYQVVPVGVFQSSEPPVTHTAETRANGTFVPPGPPDVKRTIRAGGQLFGGAEGGLRPSESQPGGGHRHSDFDLWRFLLREYAEELLGEPEVEAPDYRTWPFAKDMTAALDAGGITADVLGLGVDPLTFATDLLVRVVVDSVVFDELFGGRVAVNDEGAVSMRPFTHEAIEGLPMQAAGAALVRLALALPAR